MMATSTELLRAAEHMRTVRVGQVGEQDYATAALLLSIEAQRLQAVEARQPKPADSYCSDAVGRYEGTRVLVEETPSAYAVRLKDNPDNSLHVGKRCDGPLEPHRFLLALCKEVVRPLASRSWPEGWPPFAVLRRAYASVGVPARPSTLWCERHGGAVVVAYATSVRRRWEDAVRHISQDPSSP